MRIVDAEDQLARDFIEEIEILAAGEKGSFKVYAGRHPTLGRVVVVKGSHGDNVIVEVEE